MDKGNMPVRRARKPTNLFRNQAVNEPRKIKVTESRRRDSKDKGGLFSRAIKKILHWFGWGRSGSNDTKHNTYPRWKEKRIARNRRRRELGNISRRRNR